MTIELHRQWMAQYANSMRRQGDPVIKPSDFFTLSYDTEIKQEKPIDRDNFMKDMAARFTRKNKRNG